MRPNKVAVRVSCTTLTGADLTGADLRGGVLRTSDDRLLPLPIERCRRIRDPLRGYSWGALIALLHRMSPHLCRFSDAGNDDLSTRSGDRRPKSAKARNRGRYARSTVPQAQLWGFKR
jgi:hypothetical protein